MKFSPPNTRSQSRSASVVPQFPSFLSDLLHPRESKSTPLTAREVAVAFQRGNQLLPPRPKAKSRSRPVSPHLLAPLTQDKHVSPKSYAAASWTTYLFDNDGQKETPNIDSSDVSENFALLCSSNKLAPATGSAPRVSSQKRRSLVLPKRACALVPTTEIDKQHIVERAPQVLPDLTQLPVSKVSNKEFRPVLLAACAADVPVSHLSKAQDISRTSFTSLFTSTETSFDKLHSRSRKADDDTSPSQESHSTSNMGQLEGPKGLSRAPALPVDNFGLVSGVSTYTAVVDVFAQIRELSPATSSIDNALVDTAIRRSTLADTTFSNNTLVDTTATGSSMVDTTLTEVESDLKFSHPRDIMGSGCDFATAPSSDDSREESDSDVPVQEQTFLSMVSKHDKFSEREIRKESSSPRRVDDVGESVAFSMHSFTNVKERSVARGKMVVECHEPTDDEARTDMNPAVNGTGLSPKLVHSDSSKCILIKESSSASLSVECYETSRDKYDIFQQGTDTGRSPIDPEFFEDLHGASEALISTDQRSLRLSHREQMDFTDPNDKQDVDNTNHTLDSDTKNVRNSVLLLKKQKSTQALLEYEGSRTPFIKPIPVYESSDDETDGGFNGPLSSGWNGGALVDLLVPFPEIVSPIRSHINGPQMVSFMNCILHLCVSAFHKTFSV